MFFPFLFLRPLFRDLSRRRAKKLPGKICSDSTSWPSLCYGLEKSSRPACCHDAAGKTGQWDACLASGECKREKKHTPSLKHKSKVIKKKLKSSGLQPFCRTSLTVTLKCTSTPRRFKGTFNLIGYFSSSMCHTGKSIQKCPR